MASVYDVIFILRMNEYEKNNSARADWFNGGVNAGILLKLLNNG